MEILNIAIPAVIVFLTAYLLLDRLLKNEDKRRDYKLRSKNFSTLTPIRLRAYERLTLFLERSAPTTLLVNVTKPGMNCMELHAKLLETIRQEYSHNISQQIYVSEKLWQEILSAKEGLTKLINMCASQCDAKQPATVLAERILEVYSSLEQTPNGVALYSLKEEVGKYFR